MKSERLARSPAALTRTGGGRLLVLGATTDRVLTLEGTAHLVWELLAQPASIDELAADLAVAFGVEVDAVVSDLRPLVEHLLDAGVLAEVPGD